MNVENNLNKKIKSQSLKKNHIIKKTDRTEIMIIAICKKNTLPCIDGITAEILISCVNL